MKNWTPNVFDIEKTCPLSQAMRTVMAWIETDAWGLLLMGGVGNGKSHAAAWTWRQLRDRCYRSAEQTCSSPGTHLWLDAASLDQLSYQDRAHAARTAASADTLVVDDIGMENTASADSLNWILRAHHRDGGRAILTTNMTRSMFEQRYGDPIVDRLSDGGRSSAGGARWAVEISDPSFRGWSYSQIEKYLEQRCEQ